MNFKRRLIKRRLILRAIFVTSTLLGCRFASAAGEAKRWMPEIPRVWEEEALSEWATPVAGLNVRPTHISSKEYYSMKIENLRTYPVYFPGREPEGYWEMLQQIGPKPLIEPENLKTQADWVESGRRVFEEADLLHLRTYDPKFFAAVRGPAALSGEKPLPDGTVFGMRWVPTTQGVALGFPNCSQCHLAYRPDGLRIPGAPAFANGSSRSSGRVRIAPVLPQVQRAQRVITGAPPFLMGAEPFGMWLYRAYGVPWRKDDINEQIKNVTSSAGRARYLQDYQAGRVGKTVSSRSGKNLPPHRPKRIFDCDSVAQLRAHGLSIRQIAAKLGIGVGTAARTLQAVPKVGEGEVEQ